MIKPIHPTAQIAKSARIEENVSVGPFCVIGEKVTIGKGSRIHSHCIIEENVKLGSDCFVHSYCQILHDSVLSEGTVIEAHAIIGSEGYGYSADEKGRHHPIPQLGHVEIGKNTHIEPNVCLDRGAFLNTLVGKGSKIGCHSHFGHNVQVGDNFSAKERVVIGGSTRIKDSLSTGQRVVITGHIDIGSHVTLGDFSGLNKSLMTPGEYWGHPLSSKEDHEAQQDAMKSIVDFRKNLSKMIKSSQGET